MELTNDNLKQAKQELEEVCNKYDIILLPVIVHQGNRTTSSIEIVSRSSFVAQQEQSSQVPTA